MTMTPRTARLLLRTGHILGGACIAAVVYLPVGLVEPVRWVLAWIVVPAVTLAGLAMWQQGRIRRRLRRLRAGPSTQAPEGAEP